MREFAGGAGHARDLTRCGGRAQAEPVILCGTVICLLVPTHDTVQRMTHTQDYQAAVSEARTLVKRSEEDQWRLAELTWEQCRDGKMSRAAWAQDVGVDPSYAARLYNLWERWGMCTGSMRPPFPEAYREVSPHSDTRSISKQPTGNQVAVVQQALANPEVAAQVFNDPETKTRAIRAIHQGSAQRDPVPVPAPAPAATKLDIVVLLGEAKDHLRRAFRAAVSIGLTGDEEVLSDLGDVETEAEQFRKYLTGMDLDEAIEKIMEGS